MDGKKSYTHVAFKLLIHYFISSVCSCGKWICTSNPCSKSALDSREKLRDPISAGSYLGKKEEEEAEEEEEEEVFTYDDMDNTIQ